MTGAAAPGIRRQRCDDARMKIFVTGAAGFIGSAVTRQYIRETDAQIIGVDKLTYAGNVNSLAEAKNHPRFLLERVDIWASSHLCRRMPGAAAPVIPTPGRITV